MRAIASRPPDARKNACFRVWAERLKQRRAVALDTGTDDGGEEAFRPLVKRWLKDSSFRSLLKNSSYLAMSRIVSAICGVATLAFAGRGLGPTLFGLLVLIHSYAQLASGIAKFQSWQLVINYGSPALHRGEIEPFHESIGFAFGLDIASGMIGMVVAIAVLPWVGPWFHIPADIIPYAMIYCLLLPTMGAATPVGILRSLDRFDLVGWQSCVTPIMRAILALIAWANGAPFLAYVAIWFVTDLAGDLFIWFLAWRELRRRDLMKGIRPMLRPRKLEGAWRFAINVNLATSLTVARGPLVNLLVGVILGPAAAGLYRIGKTIAESIDKPADLLNKAFYPEVVKLDFTTKRPWKLMFRTIMLSSLLAGIVCAIILIGGEYLITELFGEKYRGSYPVTATMLLATFLGVVTFPVNPMLYALRRTDAPLVGSALGIIVLLATLYPLCTWLGLVGAGVAFLLGSIVSVIWRVFALRRQYVLVRTS